MIYDEQQQCVSEWRREGLTLCYMPPPLSLPWSRLWSRLWSPLSWLEAWLAHFPAPTHSFHCIVSDGKEQSALDTTGITADVIKTERSVRLRSITTLWPCLIVDKLQHWQAGSVHYRHHHRHGECKQKKMELALCTFVIAILVSSQNIQLRHLRAPLWFTL